MGVHVHVCVSKYAQCQVSSLIMHLPPYFFFEVGLVFHLVWMEPVNSAELSGQ